MGPVLVGGRHRLGRVGLSLVHGGNVAIEAVPALERGRVEVAKVAFRRGVVVRGCAPDPSVGRRRRVGGCRRLQLIRRQVRVLNVVGVDLGARLCRLLLLPGGCAPPKMQGRLITDANR